MDLLNHEELQADFPIVDFCTVTVVPEGLGRQFALQLPLKMEDGVN
jgi:hypothetical protein